MLPHCFLGELYMRRGCLCDSSFSLAGELAMVLVREWPEGQCFSVSSGRTPSNTVGADTPDTIPQRVEKLLQPVVPSECQMRGLVVSKVFSYSRFRGSGSSGQTGTWNQMRLPSSLHAGWVATGLCAWTSVGPSGSMESSPGSLGTWRRASTSSECAPQGGVSWRKPEPAGLRALKWDGGGGVCRMPWHWPPGWFSLTLRLGGAWRELCAPCSPGACLTVSNGDLPSF